MKQSLPHAKDVANTIKNNISPTELKHVENFATTTESYSLSLSIIFLITVLIIIGFAIKLRKQFANKINNTSNEGIDLSKGGRSDIHIRYHPRLTCTQDRH